MIYTVGEMAQKLGVPASTLRYNDKEGLLPFVDRSSGGIRMFRGNRLRVAAGHPLHEKSRNVHQGYPAVY